MMSYLCISVIILLFVSATKVNAQEDLVINEVMASNLTAQISPDNSDFVDWIEIYNKGDKIVNLQGIYLTDDLSDPYKWRLNKDVALYPNTFYIIWADGLDYENHASFKLSGNGEQIGLSGSAGVVLDTLTFGVQRNDISYGRYPDGGSTWQYFTSHTFQGPNASSGFVSNEQVPRAEFSPEGGLFSGPQTISLRATPGTLVRYTLDGSIPTQDSEEYKGPFRISETTVIRARAYKESLLPSDVGTSSFIIDEPAIFPVISISTPPEYLFDEDIGITVGICVSDKHGEPGEEPPFDPEANFWNSWERPVHLEYYTPEGILGFAQDAGIAIFGGFLGRQLRQKAFTLFARNKYGDSDFDFPLFPSKPINSYRRFILRCSSNDFNRTFIRDAMMQSLVIGQMDIDYQAYQPVIVYLNGKFWGLYNMREKTNQFYPEHNYGIDPDAVDLIEGISKTAHGDGRTYLELLDFASGNDLRIQSNYDYVKTKMDITEFMNYYITELFVCNHDWLYQNIKCWRDHSPGGKWRWLLYDLDWGFSGELTWKIEDYRDNTFQWIQEQGEASMLFQSLMENEAFRFEFIQRFATHLNLTFQTDRVLKTIEHMAAQISPEIPRQIARWGALRSIDYWQEQLEVLNSFAMKRPGYISEYLDLTYMLDGKRHLVLEVSNEESGWISVFETPVPAPSYSGIWYEGIPMQIEAHAKPGWRFVEWEGDIQSREPVIERGFFKDAVLYARFEPYELPSLMISEIHYNPSAQLQGDDEDFEFLELLNGGNERLDLSGWKFTEGITFSFPEGSYIDPGEFLLLASNPLKYKDSNAQCFKISTGKLNNAGEILTICDTGDHVIDQVSYDDHYPWPGEPDGEGPSLELISPHLDNSLASSWQASKQAGGSPGSGPKTHAEEAETIASNDLHLQIYPNPFQVSTSIRYSLKEESPVTIRIINLDGREVDNMGTSKQIPGDCRIAWTPTNLPSGMYFVHFQRKGSSQFRKVLYLGN